MVRHVDVVFDDREEGLPRNALAGVGGACQRPTSYTYHDTSRLLFNAPTPTSFFKHCRLLLTTSFLGSHLKESVHFGAYTLRVACHLHVSVTFTWHKLEIHYCIAHSLTLCVHLSP